VCDCNCLLVEPGDDTTDDVQAPVCCCVPPRLDEGPTATHIGLHLVKWCVVLLWLLAYVKVDIL